MPKLYEIATDVLALADLLDEATGVDGQMDLRVEAAAVDLQAQIEADERNELERLRQGLAALEMKASAAEAEADQYNRMSTSYRKAIDWIKNGVIKPYLESQMRTKAETATGRKFWIQANGQVGLEIDEGVKPTDVPEEFRRVTVDFDRDAIRRTIVDEAGLPDDSPRRVTFAKLGKRGTHLRYR